MEIKNYKKGDTLTYKPANAICRVVHNTLKPGGVNAEEATVWVRYRNALQGVPVAVQDDFLSTEPPVKVSKTRPLPQ